MNKSHLWIAWLEWIASARIPPGWTHDGLRARVDRVYTQHQLNLQRGKFLWKLFLMTFHPKGEGLVSWSPDGTAVVVSAGHAQWSGFLALWFQHTQLSSLTRQLNYFGFSATRCAATRTTKYAHPDFTRDNCQLHRIRRKTFHGTPVPPAPPSPKTFHGTPAPKPSLPKRPARRSKRPARRSKRLAREGAVAREVAWPPWSPHKNESTVLSLQWVDLNHSYDEAQQNLLPPIVLCE